MPNWIKLSEQKPKLLTNVLCKVKPKYLTDNQIEYIVLYLQEELLNGRLWWAANMVSGFDMEFDFNPDTDIIEWSYITE